MSTGASRKKNRSQRSGTLSSTCIWGSSRTKTIGSFGLVSRGRRSKRWRCSKGGVMATLADFQQLDVRVATVISAELHPNADRLLVLRIDLGGNERQIVAGIRASYEPSALVGKQIVVVADLEPAKLRGIESQGMLLAARDGDRVVLVTPEAAVAAGSKVS